jgi:hypothetical protein
MIEEKIQQLIEALNANTAALLKHGQVNVTTTTQPIKLIESEHTVAGQPVVTPVATPAVAVIDDTLAKIEKLKADQAAQKAVEQAAKPASSITLESLTELALKVVSLGPTAAKRIKALNEGHGIKRITECPPDKFQAVWDSLIELRKELGGVE